MKRKKEIGTLVTTLFNHHFLDVVAQGRKIKLINPCPLTRKLFFSKEGRGVWKGKIEKIGEKNVWYRFFNASLIGWREREREREKKRE